MINMFIEVGDFLMARKNNLFFLKHGFVDHLTHEQKQVVRALCVTCYVTLEELQQDPHKHRRALAQVVIYLKQKGFLYYSIAEFLNIEEEDVDKIVKDYIELLQMDFRHVCRECLQPIVKRGKDEKDYYK